MPELPARIEVRTFGGVRAELDGHDLALGGPQEQVIAAILASRREAIAIDELVEVLWPDDAPPTARKTIQVYLSRLRGRLGAGALVRESGGYRLARSPALTVDLDLFESEIAAAESALSGDPVAALRRYEAALSIASGRPFGGLPSPDVLERTAARLDERRWEARLGRWTALVRLRPEAAVAELRSAIAEQPFREHLWAVLMQALYLSGRQAEALQAFQDARRGLVDELGVEPGPELEAMQRRVLQHDPALGPEAPGSRRAHLPRLPARLVGREREIADLRGRLLGAGTQLVTITGPGGVGKTSVAVHVAGELAADFTEAVFVDVSSIRDPALLESSITAAMGASGELAARIGSTRTLLVLDNLEQIRGAARPLATLLSRCENLVILATSRVPLRIRAEEQVPLEPLQPAAAVELLQRRVRSGGVPALPDTIAREICERLDRIPLAIELAAARARSLSPDDMLTQLDRRLSFLTQGFADAPARQQTLTATIAWSVELSSPAQRDVLVALAVFRGGFSRGAAEAVADASLDDLATLVDASLIRREDDRYRFLELIHEFAADRLAERRDAAEVRRRHAEFFRDRVLAAPRTSRGLYVESLAPDIDNIRASLEYFLEEPATDTALDMCIALAQTWLFGGAFREGDLAFERAAARADRSDEARWADALSWWGEFARARGDHERARSLYEAALGLLEAGLPGSGRLGTFKALGQIAHAAGDLDLARARFEQALDAAVEAADLLGIAHVELSMGEIELELGHFEAAAALYERVVAVYRRPDVRARDEARPAGLFRLGQARVRTGRLDEARILFIEALERVAELEWADGMRFAIQGVAALLGQLGRAEDAVRLLVTADALIAASGVSDNLPIELARTEESIRRSGADVAALHARATPIPSSDLLRETLAMLADAPVPTTAGR